MDPPWPAVAHNPGERFDTSHTPFPTGHRPLAPFPDPDAHGYRLIGQPITATWPPCALANAFMARAAHYCNTESERPRYLVVRCHWPHCLTISIKPAFDVPAPICAWTFSRRPGKLRTTSMTTIPCPYTTKPCLPAPSPSASSQPHQIPCEGNCGACECHPSPRGFGLLPSPPPSSRSSVPHPLHQPTRLQQAISTLSTPVAPTA